MTKCPLKPGELEAVQLFADGETAKSSARKTNTSPHSINFRLNHARRVVDVKTTTALVATALRKGWIK